jgi:O-antigen/teichoic acid export membrane protein
MSRYRNYFHAIWSGYLLTAVIALLNLVTIPIAVSVLGKPGYGLWCAVMTVAAFTNIFDLGLGPSMARFFTDYKDHHDKRAYGDFVKSLFFVGALQALLFATVTFCLLPYAPKTMRIDSDQATLFKALLLLQLGTTALAFPLRPFNQILFANQQIARQNSCYIAATLANAVVLIGGLKCGLGIYAYVAAAWTAFVINQSGLLFFVLKLRLMPPLREAKISLQILKPMAVFSSNVFLTSLGSQLINLAPGLLITRKLGLPALADWTVGTRLLTMVIQLIGRIPNSSEPVFWEMFSRSEFARARQRLLELLLFTGSAVALLGGGLAATNAPFIALWMRGGVQWSSAADIVLALWMLVSMTAVIFNMVPGMTKHLGSMVFVYLLEGGIMIGLAFLPGIGLHSFWQVALALLVFECLFRFPYGLWRAHRDLQISGRTIAGTLGRAFGIAAFLLATAGLLRFVTSGWAALPQVLVNGLAYTAVALPVIYYWGLPDEPRQRVQHAVLSRLKRK